MADGLQTSFQYLLIALGIVVVALAVWMAKENMWWLAIPDALFGIGIAWFARIGLHEKRTHPQAAVEPVAAPAPAPQTRPEPAASEDVPEPATPVAAGAAASRPEPQPGGSKRKKKKRRH